MSYLGNFQRVIVMMIFESIYKQGIWIKLWLL